MTRPRHWLPMPDLWCSSLAGADPTGRRVVARRPRRRARRRPCPGRRCDRQSAEADEAEGGPKLPQGRLLVGVDLSHGPGRLPPGWLVASGPQVRVDPAALELELVDLALAVVLAVILPAAPCLGADRLAPVGRVTQSSLAACRCALRLICPRTAGTGLAHLVAGLVSA